MNYVQIGAYGGGPGPGNGGNDMSNSGRGGAQMGGMMMQQQQQQGQQGNAYQNSGNGGGAYSQPMMRVPSSGSLGMMPPGTPGYGYGGEQGQARRGFEASGKGAKRAAGKNAGGKGSGAKRGKEGKGAEMMDGGPGGAGTWNYGAPPPQMQHRVQQGGMVYHQRNPSSHRMMTQQQHMGSMYSGSSSVSTTISGNSAGVGRGNAGMMMPPYYMNQSGVGPNDGQIHVRGRSPTNDMSAAEAGLVELEAIIGKLDKATSHNIKESLYRLARSAGARRARAAAARAAVSTRSSRATRHRAAWTGAWRTCCTTGTQTRPRRRRTRSRKGAVAADGRRRRRRKRTRCLGRRAGGDERHSRQARLGVRFEPSQRVVAT